MIIRLTAHRSSQDVVVVHAGPDLADFMGRFAFARWQSQAKAYWVEITHLSTFWREAERCGHTLVDDRAKSPEAEKFSGPLPECGNPECRLPALRKVSDVMKFCPACGADWAPTIPAFTPAGLAVRGECADCGRTQAGGFTRCSACGGLIVQVVTGKRPDHVPRPKLTEPTLFADAAAELLDQMERDHRQRAAGDR